VIDRAAGNRVKRRMAIPSKFVEERPYSKPEVAAAKLIEIARTLRVDKGRIRVGEWNDTFRKAGSSVAEYSAGCDHAIAARIIEMHECGGFVMFKTVG
jgi:hypothetical protein